MEIKFDKHCCSKSIERQVLKLAKKIIPKVLGKRTKVITTLQIKLQTRFTGHEWDDFNRKFDCGKVHITIFSNWMNGGPVWKAYGLRHELIHVRDVMDGLLIGLPPKKGRNFRVNWRPTRAHKWTTYSRHIPDWLADRVYDEREHKIFLEMMTVAYPWERETILALGKDKVA